jgi:hypothetical protein
MRHRASRPLIDLWRGLPRATARPLGLLADLSRVRMTAAFMVMLSLATVACVVVASVGAAPTDDAQTAALGDQGGQIELGGGESTESTPDTPTSTTAQSQSPAAPDPSIAVPSSLRSTVDQRTGSADRGTASPSLQPSATASTAPEDQTPPDTSLSEEYPASDAALFSFTANEPASFTCSLDGAAYAPCDSPASYSELDPGWHTFAVRATDVAGNVDPSPASVRWRTGPAHSTAQ